MSLDFKKRPIGEDINIRETSEAKKTENFQHFILFKHNRTHDIERVISGNQCSFSFERPYTNSTDSIHHVQYDTTFHNSQNQ
jgi:hypothetical protein